MASSAAQTTTQSTTSPAWAALLRRLSPVFRTYLIIAVPVVLTLINVRLVMTTTFLEFEYNRPGFPEDTYGFTTEDRLEYAPYALEYLLNDADISYLGDLTFPDGEPLYNARELKHMEDVKVVTRYAFFLLTYGGLAALVIVGLLALTPFTRRDLRLGLFQGATLTLTLIGVIVVSAVIAWEAFFTLFHQLFFEAGTWRFYFSDTLIRLFPEQFWFDASIIIGVLTALGALLILGITWGWMKNAPHTLNSPEPEQEPDESDSVLIFE